MEWVFSPLLSQNAIWIVALIGAAMGSFLSLITYRFIHEQPMLGARSHCAACGKTLSARDLIPIISWFAMRGNARCCGARISARYPLMEIACAVGASLMVYVFGWNALTLVYIGMWWCVVGLMTADLEAYYLPDILMIPLGLLGIAHAYILAFDPTNMVVAALTGWIVSLLLHFGGAWLLGRPALGLGDVKLFGVAGIWLGSVLLLVPYVFFAGMLGILLAFMWRIAGKGQAFPFGPAMLIALIACVLYPDTMRWFWQIYL